MEMDGMLTLLASNRKESLFLSSEACSQLANYTAMCLCLSEKESLLM